MGRTTNHVHVWKSLLERAGFTLADIPKEWERFWVFWCDEVQPAVRRALGRDDIWGVGLAMSAGPRHPERVLQFLAAYEADYVTRDGRLVIDDPEVRRKLIRRSTATRPSTARAAPRPIRSRGTATAITRRSWLRPS